MKNVIKRIASITMAVTLLGTGAAVSKNIAPQFDNAIIANAASCNHVAGASARNKDGNWEYISMRKSSSLYYDIDIYYKMPVRCVKCGELLWYRYKKEYCYYVTDKKTKRKTLMCDTSKTEYWIGRFIW